MAETIIGPDNIEGIRPSAVAICAGEPRNGGGREVGTIVVVSVIAQEIGKLQLIVLGDHRIGSQIIDGSGEESASRVLTNGRTLIGSTVGRASDVRCGCRGINDEGERRGA